MVELHEIVRILDGMDSNDLVALWNEHTDAHRYYDDRIYFMQEFDELECDIGPRSDETPLDFVARMQRDFGTFDVDASYFVIGIYGFEAFNYLDDKESPFDMEALANSIRDGNVDVSDYDELAELIEEDEGEDNEE